MNSRIGWGQPPPGWGLPNLPGWAPLVDPGPRTLRAVSSVARWWWPILVVGGFLAVVVQVLGHADSARGLSNRGLLTIALAALVVVLLSIHRRNGPGPLARAVAEYTVVAVLAGLLAGAGAGVGQQPTNRPASAETRAQAAPGDDRPAVLQAGAKVIRAVTGAARALAGGVRWLVDLWRQADQQATPANEAMVASPLSAPLILASHWSFP